MTSVLDREREAHSAEDTVPRRNATRVFELAAGAWLVVVALWSIVGLVQLRTAAGLIALEGEQRGFPITDMSHFSEVPELAAEFDAANLGLQHPFLWVILMAGFALVGVFLAIGVSLSASPLRNRLATSMLAVWLFGVTVAVANGETLTLVMWLTN